KASLDAARLALEIAQATHATLTAAYSVPPMMMPGDVPFTVVSEVLKAEVARGKQVLAEVREQLGNPDLTLVELEGSPAERVAQLAEDEGFDLVVVGSRGRNAVARMFLGSVANRLVHICKKPVLVVR
ncbi:MAG: universal stress protein UspA, partial [Myxococcaceae bacterium]|nr:universal stress protein UspA [Myxococcaceae bacterium]